MKGVVIQVLWLCKFWGLGQDAKKKKKCGVCGDNDYLLQPLGCLKGIIFILMRYVMHRDRTKMTRSIQS